MDSSFLMDSVIPTFILLLFTCKPVGYREGGRVPDLLKLIRKPYFDHFASCASTSVSWLEVRDVKKRRIEGENGRTS